MRRPSEKGQAKGKSEGLDDIDDHGDPEYLSLDSTYSEASAPSTSTNELQPNPPKRPKVTHKKICLSDLNAQEEMERLEAELQKKNPDKKFVKKALESTFPQRRNWIEEDCPLVGEILQKYPVFKKSRYVCMYV